MSKKTGIVFNIQRFTIHDGPGIRTEVLLAKAVRCNGVCNPERAFIPEVGSALPLQMPGERTPAVPVLEVFASLGGAPLSDPETENRRGGPHHLPAALKCILSPGSALKSWGDCG